MYNNMKAVTIVMKLSSRDSKVEIVDKIVAACK